VVPFDWTLEEWIDIPQTVEGWADHLRDLADKTLEQGAEDTLQQVDDTFVPFDVTTPEVANWIETRLATQIKTIVENRQSDVRKLVVDAASEGRTIGQLEIELRDKFDRNNRAWSTRIARTETAGLYNQGAVEGLREAGIEFKEWLSSRDIDVRTTHGIVDGTSIPIDDNFTVGDATGPGPGQMNRPEETINCRCALIMGETAHGPED
jgi:SPP1 gp7 family putative phage head morphogenesis protein